MKPKIIQITFFHSLLTLSFNKEFWFLWFSCVNPSFGFCNVSHMSILFLKALMLVFEMITLILLRSKQILLPDIKFHILLIIYKINEKIVTENYLKFVYKSYFKE